MKLWLLPLALALAACSHPMLSANLVFGEDGPEVYPTLSGEVGGATVSVEP